MQLLLTLLLSALLLSLTPPSFAGSAKKRASTCGTTYPSDAAIEWDCVRLKRRESLEGLFGDRWQDVARFNRIDRRHAWPGFALKVPRNLEDIAGFAPLPPFIPAAEPDAKFILIDLSEQFLGAYEFGHLAFSMPVASGNRKFPTPTGEYRIDAYDRRHISNLYTIEQKDTPYPMWYALRFHTSMAGVDYWIHGRDLPGFPDSHGCVGLYDEEMQLRYYGHPQRPLLMDAKDLFIWATGMSEDNSGIHRLKNGPRLSIVGAPPE